MVTVVGWTILNNYKSRPSGVRSDALEATRLAETCLRNRTIPQELVCRAVAGMELFTLGQPVQSAGVWILKQGI